MVEIIDEETGEVTIDRKKLDTLHLKYRGGLVPRSSVEDLDLTPLQIPFDCEKPLTFREQLLRYGYFADKALRNPDLYDEDEDAEDLDDSDMISAYSLDDEGQNSIDREALRKQAEADEIARLVELGKKAVSQSPSDENTQADNLPQTGDEE